MEKIGKEAGQRWEEIVTKNILDDFNTTHWSWGRESILARQGLDFDEMFAQREREAARADQRSPVPGMIYKLEPQEDKRGHSGRVAARADQRSPVRQAQDSAGRGATRDPAPTASGAMGSGRIRRIRVDTRGSRRLCRPRRILPSASHSPLSLAVGLWGVMSAVVLSMVYMGWAIDFRLGLWLAGAACLALALSGADCGSSDE